MRPSSTTTGGSESSATGCYEENSSLRRGRAPPRKEAGGHRSSLGARGKVGITAIVMTLGSLAYQAAFPDPESPIEIEDGIGVGLSVASTAISAVMYVDGY